ncbi:MAG: ATP-binding cassette domain-containing protein [Chitinophagales bacterium]|nr:ATP-binding cassette domain-containing protein [Chitinophagales bacterium]
MLVTQNLKFEYTPQVKFNFPDITCSQGDSIVISGNSGTGKTTLLHILGGLSKPNSGSVKLNDTEISALIGSSLDKFRGKNISIIFQKMHFISSINALENILLAQWLTTGIKDKNIVLELLERLNIVDQRNKDISQLSQGQKQRLAIARALINKPSLILADEPTSSLDNKNAEIVERLLKESATSLNAALVIVTHDMRMKEHSQNLIELI